jgi:undecaprenyl-diphosphatase
MPQLLHVDVTIRTWIVLHRLPVLTSVMWGLSAIGRGGIVWLLIAAVLTAMKRLRPREWAQLALVLLVTSAMTDVVLKPIVGRERPFIHSLDVAVIGGRPASDSFPSGHAAIAFAGAVVLSRFAPVPALAWWVLAAAIAYSRLYLGVHYPSDVVAGALVGIACAVTTLAIVRRAGRPNGRRGSAKRTETVQRGSGATAPRQ